MMFRVKARPPLIGLDKSIAWKISHRADVAFAIGTIAIKRALDGHSHKVSFGIG